uniref:E3 ubiquitin-protein ligase RNF25 n=1 Tax=Anolis carolinensis TaxID=28377 RepID=A0A803TWC9_ANOCA|nr:PREDICTED: E3 ubiquitin-protein ligase RNF25 isoform X1 [Anolis carolinensis]|eukprot:XP_008108339.1 PREDICTED: E3 ubiquitin-protein ligase RNF25 isoform X1 [Anolis carolinensis]
MGLGGREEHPLLGGKMAAAGGVAGEAEEAASDWILPSEEEVLESIYLDELQVSKGNDRSEPWEISIVLHPATAEDQDSQYVCFTLVLSVPVQYPKEVPKITIQNPRGLSDEQIQKILQTLQNIAKARLGTAMLYELIEKGKEILTDNNIPHGQCVICLYGFQENEAFIKTPCYHYFHSYCLASYTQHMEEEKRAQKKERLPTLASQSKEEDDVPCPVCRKPLVYDLATLQAAPPPQQPMEVYQPDTAMKLHREQLSLIYQRQQAKGGIIDPEAERNRYFISLQKPRTVERKQEFLWTLPKLENEGGNYLNWKRRLELFLNSKEAEVCDQDPPSPEDEGYIDWLQSDRLPSGAPQYEQEVITENAIDAEKEVKPPTSYENLPGTIKTIPVVNEPDKTERPSITFHQHSKRERMQGEKPSSRGPGWQQHYRTMEVPAETRVASAEGEPRAFSRRPNWRKERGQWNSGKYSPHFPKLCSRDQGPVHMDKKEVCTSDASAVQDGVYLREKENIGGKWEPVQKTEAQDKEKDDIEVSHSEPKEPTKWQGQHGTQDCRRWVKTKNREYGSYPKMSRGQGRSRPNSRRGSHGQEAEGGV